MTNYIDLESLAPTDELAKERARGLNLTGKLIPSRYRLGLFRVIGDGDTLYCGPRFLHFWRWLPEGVRLVNIEEPLVQDALPNREPMPKDYELPLVWATFSSDLEEIEGKAEDHPYRWRLVEGKDDIELFLNLATTAHDEMWGVDVETDVAEEGKPNARKDTIVGVGVSIGQEGFYGLATDEQWMAALRQVLPTAKWTGSNAKYDYTSLRRAGIPIAPPSGDSVLAAYLLGSPRAGLKWLVERDFGVRMITYEDLTGKGKGKRRMSEVDPQRQAEYCVGDCYWGVREEGYLRDQLDEARLRLYYEVDLPLIELLVEMEDLGIPVDREAMRVELIRVEGNLAGLGAIIDALAREDGYAQEDKGRVCKGCHNGKKKRVSCEECHGEGKFYERVPFNPNSSNQLAAWFHEKVGLPVQRISRETAQASMDALALLRMKDKHPAIGLILNWKHFEKERQFLEAWLKESEEDGKLHTTFTNSVVRSPRFSSTQPNLQQVKPAWRKWFKAEEGEVLVAADYGQIEVRVAAYVSHDPELVRIMQGDPNTFEGDIHAQNVYTLFGIPYEYQKEDKFKPLRTRAKNFMFGALYGSKGAEVHDVLEKQFLSDPTLAGEDIPTIEEIGRGILALAAKYGRYFQEWVPYAVDKARRDNCTTYTLYGRPRVIPNMDSRVPQERAAAERECISHIIQGSAADLIRLAMLRAWKLGRGILSLTVHDELVARPKLADWGVDSEGKVWYTQLLSKAMLLEQPLEDVPLVVTAKSADNWYDTHG